MPGNGWLRGSARPKFAGERDGAQLALSGDNIAIDVDGSAATVKDAEGQVLGELKKVRRRREESAELFLKAVTTETASATSRRS